MYLNLQQRHKVSFSSNFSGDPHGKRVVGVNQDEKQDIDVNLDEMDSKRDNSNNSNSNSNSNSSGSANTRDANPRIANAEIEAANQVC